MQSIRKGNNIGFTLIELLIVTALLAVVSLAIYAAFNNGIKIWQKINEEVLQEELDIFLEEFTVDLRNTFKFSGFNFVGAENQLEFATLVDSQRMHRDTAGKVIYLYDQASKIIEKISLDFSHLYEGGAGITKKLAGGVESLKFQYYFYDKAAKEYIWFDEWTKEGLPLAVRVQLDFLDGGKQSGLVKTISVPVSN